MTSSAQGRATSRPNGSIDAELERDHASTSRATCAVVERDAAVGELHLRVGALARDHDDVARTCVRERRLDRLAPVEHDLEPPVRDLGGDRRGILGARIVGRDDRPVGERRGDPPHQRPLLAVAVAARAEDDGQRGSPSSRAARSTFSSESGVCA